MSGALKIHEDRTKGIHGVGSGTIAKVSDIATDANLSSAAQDAISKRHTQGTDQGLDTGGANAVTAAQTKTAYDHSQDNTQAHTDYLLNNADDTTTGNLTISKADPTLTLTDTGDSNSAILTRADTGGKFTLTNKVYKPGSSLTWGSSPVDRAAQSGNNQTFINTQSSLASSGQLISAQMWSPGTNGTDFYIKVFRDDGTNYVYVGQDGPFSASAGLNTWTLNNPIDVLAGDFIGIFIATAANSSIELTVEGSNTLAYKAGANVTSTQLKTYYTAGGYTMSLQGTVSSTGTDVTATVVDSSDSDVVAGEEGIHKFGHIGGATHIQGALKILGDGTHTTNFAPVYNGTKFVLQKITTSQISDTAGILGSQLSIGTKNPPIDADKVVYKDSAASDVLVTSTWTQIKAYLKGYWDTLYVALTGDQTIAGVKTFSSPIVSSGASLTAASVPSSALKGYVYVPRLCSGFDYSETGSKAGLNTDGTWKVNGLNIGPTGLGIVPAGAVAVSLFVIVVDDEANKTFGIRRDSANIRNAIGIAIQVANIEINRNETIPIDTDGKLDYYGDNVAFTGIYIAVTGWYI